MEKILLAGATGYLGRYILEELKRREIPTKVIVRNEKKLPAWAIDEVEVQKAEVTDAASISGCCEGISVVISTVGITRQQDGLTYMDVDYQANLNLLEDAKKHGVKKFIYVSAFNGDKITQLKIAHAKEKFVDALKASGMAYCIMRPNGFFSDMAEMYQMAKKGRIYLFGNGELKSNPIHGADLAEVCVDAIDSTEQEIDIGGPETLTQNDIAGLAFEAAGLKKKITYIPDWVRRAVLKLGKVFMREQKFGPIEFFMTVLAMEMVAPAYGKHRLGQFYHELKQEEEKGKIQ